jgi:capsular exopolysaccharide synthesis family protein
MINENIITHNSPKSPISEAYRVLRTNLQFTGLDSPLQVVVVTSSGPSEGKSTTVANLAVTFAQSGSKVIIVDGDLRKPRIHKIFGITNRFGTTNAIVEPLALEDYTHKTPIDGLSILTSGPIPPNPSELLGSNKMKGLLSSLKELYDIILIDSPPVGMVTDAQVLSTLADGTIIVAASGQVTVDALTRARDLLQNVNAKILGVIVNKLEKDSNGYYYDYYYRSYEDENMPRSRKKKRRASEL